MKLVFLHGLLGDKDDWQNVIQNCPHVDCISLDLPFHGNAKNIAVKNFEDCANYLSSQLQSAVKNEAYVLVGYSLGGRIALYYALQAQYEKGNLQGLILEGANLGLTDETEKTTRWQNDEKWANRFCTESTEFVLNDWYQQPVFAHLNKQERTALIQKRAGNYGENIGKMLRATSLAKQPYLGDKVRSSLLPIYYFVGEKDQKFRQIAECEKLNTKLIIGAGHNTHLENPMGFVKALQEIFA